MKPENILCRSLIRSRKWSIPALYFSQNSLVRLLTAKERDTARTAFLNLDQDKDGLVTRAECRQAQQSWFHTLSKDSQCCNVRWVRRSSRSSRNKHGLGFFHSFSVLWFSISHVGPIYESSPTSLGRDCIKPDESRFVLSLSLSQLSQVRPKLDAGLGMKIFLRTKIVLQKVSSCKTMICEIDFHRFWMWKWENWGIQMNKRSQF